jgi:hypothetical protein
MMRLAAAAQSGGAGVTDEAICQAAERSVDG